MTSPSLALARIVPRVPDASAMQRRLDALNAGPSGITLLGHDNTHDVFIPRKIIPDMFGEPSSGTKVYFAGIAAQTEARQALEKSLQSVEQSPSSILSEIERLQARLNSEVLDEESVLRVRLRIIELQRQLHPAYQAERVLRGRVNSAHDELYFRYPIHGDLRLIVDGGYVAATPISYNHLFVGDLALQLGRMVYATFELNKGPRCLQYRPSLDRNNQFREEQIVLLASRLLGEFSDDGRFTGPLGAYADSDLIVPPHLSKAAEHVLGWLYGIAHSSGYDESYSRTALAPYLDQFFFDMIETWGDCAHGIQKQHDRPPAVDEIKKLLEQTPSRGLQAYLLGTAFEVLESHVGGLRSYSRKEPSDLLALLSNDGGSAGMTRSRRGAGGCRDPYPPILRLNIALALMKEVGLKGMLDPSVGEYCTFIDRYAYPLMKMGNECRNERGYFLVLVKRFAPNLYARFQRVREFVASDRCENVTINYFDERMIISGLARRIFGLPELSGRRSLREILNIIQQRWDPLLSEVEGYPEYKSQDELSPKNAA